MASRVPSHTKPFLWKLLEVWLHANKKEDCGIQEAAAAAQRETTGDARAKQKGDQRCGPGTRCRGKQCGLLSSEQELGVLEVLSVLTQV